MTMPVPTAAVVVFSINIELPLNQVRLVPLLWNRFRHPGPVGETHVQLFHVLPDGSSFAYQWFAAEIGTPTRPYSA